MKFFSTCRCMRDTVSVVALGIAASACGNAPCEFDWLAASTGGSTPDWSTEVPDEHGMSHTLACWCLDDPGDESDLLCAMVSDFEPCEGMAPLWVDLDADLPVAGRYELDVDEIDDARVACGKE